MAGFAESRAGFKSLDGEWEREGMEMAAGAREEMRNVNGKERTKNENDRIGNDNLFFAVLISSKDM